MKLDREVQARAAERGATLWAISVDPVSEAKAMKERYKLGFELLSDPDMSTVKAYGVAMKGRDIAVPAIFIIDKQQRVRFAYVGTTIDDRPDPEELLTWLAQVAEQDAPG